MSRLFRRGPEREKGLWRRIVDLGMTDVKVLAGGVDEASLEDLEETLLRADFGVASTLRLTDLAERALRRGTVRGEELLELLRGEVTRILGSAGEPDLRASESGPTVYLVVGVNGVGKTTSIAKLAHYLKGEGKSVLLAAADTYRAGAVAQLEAWAARTGVGFLRGQEGGDPAAVAHDALEAAEAREIDVVLIDTAGRLHTNRDLMDELSKIDRVVRRRLPGAPHETLLVLDATVGQNAIRQVEAFRAAVDVSGIVLAKLDSSARAGIVVALQEQYGVPVKLVGTGEGLDDLRTFDVDSFVNAVFSALA